MKYSIIVPVYNCEQYVREAIESVIRQTYSCWELILVDDGSEDKSGQICDEYSRSYSDIKVIHQINQGPLKARNHGVEAASGDYLLFLDSDDYLSEQTLEVFENTIERTNADVVFFKTMITDTHELYRPDQINRGEVITGEETILTESFIKATYGHLTENCIRKELALAAVQSARSYGSMCNFRYCEDTFFSYLCLKNAKNICRIPDVLYCYRMNESGTCHTLSLNDYIGQWNYFRTIYDELYQRIDLAEFRYEEWTARINYCIWYFLQENIKTHAYRQFRRIAKEERKYGFLNLCLKRKTSDRSKYIFLMLYYYRMYFLVYCFPKLYGMVKKLLIL